MKDHQVQAATKLHLPKWMGLFIYGTVEWFEKEEDCQIHIKCDIIFPVVPLALSPWQNCLQRLQGMSCWAAASPLMPAPFPSSTVEVLPTLLILQPTTYLHFPYDSLGSNHFGCFQQLEVHFLPAIHWLFQHYIFAKMWPGWGSPWSTNCWVLFTLTLFLCPFLGTSYWPRLRNTTVGYQSLYKIIRMVLYGKCSMFLSFYNALFMLCYNKCKSVWVMRLYYFQEKGCFFF